MSEPLPLPQEPGIDCISFQLNTQEAAAGKVLTCLDSAGNANWGTGGSGGGISTLVVTGDTTLPNSSNNVLINASSGSIITLMLPASPTNGTFYNIIQPNNVKVVLVDISMAKTFNIAYINMTTSSFSNFIGTKFVYIPNFNLLPSGPFITYSIIYDSSNTTWKTLNLGNAPVLSTITNTSTLVANRLYGMYQERNTVPGPIVLTFTNQDNLGRIYTGQTIGLSSNKPEALIEINGSIVSSGVTNGSGVLQFNTVSDSATTFNAQITCSYSMPAETAPNTSSVTIAFSVDASTMVTNKTDVSADGKDYAEITATIKDANNNLYSGKTVDFTNQNGTSITINPTSVVSNGSGESKTQVSSNTLQSAIIIQGTNTTDGYILPQTVSLNFINPDPIPTYGTVYAWYRWDTYNQTEKKWYDYYNVNNGPISSRAYADLPTVNNGSKYLEFRNADIFNPQYYNFAPGSAYFAGASTKSGCYFARIYYTNPSQRGESITIRNGNPLGPSGLYNIITNEFSWTRDIFQRLDGSSNTYYGQGFNDLASNSWIIFCIRMRSNPLNDNIMYSIYTELGGGTYSLLQYSSTSSGPPIADWSLYLDSSSYIQVGSGNGTRNTSNFNMTDLLIYQDADQISDADILAIIQYLASINQ